jgi:hypothetical protein
MPGFRHMACAKPIASVKAITIARWAKRRKA